MIFVFSFHLQFVFVFVFVFELFEVFLYNPLGGHRAPNNLVTFRDFCILYLYFPITCNLHFVCVFVFVFQLVDIFLFVPDFHLSAISFTVSVCEAGNPVVNYSTDPLKPVFVFNLILVFLCICDRVRSTSCAQQPGRPAKVSFYYI